MFKRRSWVAPSLIAAVVAASVGGKGGYAQESAPVPEIEAITASMKDFVTQKEVAGVVTMIGNSKGIAHLSATGLSDIENNKPMTADTLFWIASMSKPVTGVCVMMMVEEGKISLDEPITTYLPEMKDLKLEDGTPAVITVRHLMTHTSGMAELPDRQSYKTKNLKEAADLYTKVKVLFPPGSKWQYSQTSINTAARIVEVVSGMTFDRFVEERLCKPLKMKDTAFYLTDAQVQRLAKSYGRTEQGGLQLAELMILPGKKPTDRDRIPAANGGLFSTANDYARFCRMLLNGGELDGVRILSKKSAETFRTPCIGNLVTGFTPGNTWGIGCCIVKEPQGVTEALSPGSFGHGGAYGTQAWCDPVKDRFYILMVSRSNFPNSDNSELRRKLQEIGAKELSRE